jgi:hypothetical protein
VCRKTQIILTKQGLDYIINNRSVFMQRRCLTLPQWHAKLKYANTKLFTNVLEAFCSCDIMIYGKKAIICGKISIFVQTVEFLKIVCYNL